MALERALYSPYVSTLGCSKVVRHLIGAGADKNIASGNGETPLHVASTSGWIAVTICGLFTAGLFKGIQKPV